MNETLTLCQRKRVEGTKQKNFKLWLTGFQLRDFQLGQKESERTLKHPCIVFWNVRMTK